jgi:hypothetical protein
MRVALAEIRAQSDPEEWLKLHATFYCKKLKVRMAKKWCAHNRTLPEDVQKMSLEDYRKIRKDPRRPYICGCFKPFACRECKDYPR